MIHSFRSAIRWHQMHRSGESKTKLLEPVPSRNPTHLLLFSLPIGGFTLARFALNLAHSAGSVPAYNGYREYMVNVKAYSAASAISPLADAWSA